MSRKCAALLASGEPTSKSVKEWRVHWFGMAHDCDRNTNLARSNGSKLIAPLTMKNQQTETMIKASELP